MNIERRNLMLKLAAVQYLQYCQLTRQVTRSFHCQQTITVLGVHMKKITLVLASESEQQYLHNLVRLFSDPEQILSAAAARQTTYKVTDVCANQTLYLLHNAGKNWAMTSKSNK